MHSRFSSRAAALLLVASLVGCDSYSVNPVSGKTIYPGSPANEIKAGEKLNPEMIADYGLYTNPALQEYVTRVGLALAQHAVRKDVKYTFTILDDDYANAFAVPGGYVYITRGALSFVNNEAELAGILAHEIGHVDAFHFGGGERDRQSILLSVLLRHSSSSAEDLALADKLAEKSKKGSSYSQQDELEADALGIHYMTLAGYDPQAMASMLRTDEAMERLENEAMKDNPVALDIFSLNVTHPATPERVVRAQEAANKAGVAPGAGKTDRDAYLAAVDGMAYGPNPRQGRVEGGRRLVNDFFGYSFEAPEGFNLWADRHGAFGVGGKALLYLEIDQAPAATSMATYVQESVTDEGTVGNVRALQLDEAYRGATGTVDIAPFMMRVAAVRDSGGSRRLFKLTYMTPSRDFRAADAGFLASLKSFRPLGRTDASMPVPRLRIVTVAGGDTVQSLAERMAVTERKLEWFRLLNGLGPGDAVKAGDKVKLVELK
jgi:predicted Zn-dependent protease